MNLTTHPIQTINLPLSPANLDTYYLYNDGGMISYILPPKAMANMISSGNFSLTQTGISALIFKYVYDSAGRVIQKTVPGNVTITIIYDPLFRPVLVQDANMAVNYQWNYIKYDAKGRPVSQGIYTDPSHTAANMAAYVNSLASSYNTAWYESKNGTAATGYYTNNIFPNGSVSGSTLTPLAYEFYDNYDLLNNGTAHYSYYTTGLPGEAGATTAQIKGMPTMVYKSTVSNTVAATWLMSVQFYDHNLHPIQAQTNNLLYTTPGATVVTDYKTTVPDFTGMPTVSLTSVQSSGSVNTQVQTTITYDQMYRVTAVDQNYNGGATVHIAAYTYNELGEVIMKSLGYINTTTWLQNVNFRYSIRGQLLNINNSKLIDDGGVTSNDSNDLFGMQMLYDGSDGNLNGGHGNTALFDGRPSAVKWMSTDASGNKSYERSYVYNYDGVARYTGEIYSERTVTGTGHFSNNVDGFDESGITYDQNGNILTLQRNSSIQSTNSYTQIDNLNYTYSTTQPNQLSTVTDGAGSQYTGAGFRNLTGSATPYAYDPNGNLTNDYYKGLQNGYNVLNRVDNTIVTTGTSQYINYIYDASGQLIRKQEYNNNVLGTTTDYIGGFVYLTQGTGAAALSYFSRPEGRVLVNGSAFTQQFIITDGQGNARISFQNNGASVAVVKQENSYYGFGLQLLNSPVSLPPKPNKKLYNGGSEWQNDYTNGDTNLPDYYQTFNRNYDAAIGRFVQTDPDPESAESMTSYQYAGNMPIMMNDPDGDKVVPGNTYNYNYVSPLMPQNGPLNGITQQQFSDAFFAATGAAGDIENAGGSLPGGQNIFNTIFSELTGIISNNNYNASIHNSVASQEYAEMNGTGPAGYLSVYYQTSSQSTYAGQRPQSINGVNDLNQINIEGHTLLVPVDLSNGTGYTFTTITSHITIPQINGPFFHASEDFYTGTVAGKEGEHRTINATKDLRGGGGLDESTKIFGLSFGYAVDNSGFNLSFGFSNSTYTLGASEEGITYGSSMLNGSNLNGHVTTFTPTPLSGSVVVGAAVLSTVVNFFKYVY